MAVSLHMAGRYAIYYLVEYRFSGLFRYFSKLISKNSIFIIHCYYYSVNLNYIYLSNMYVGIVIL